MKKRVLAIMLACMMLVSVLPMGSLAAGVQICPDVHTKDNCEYTLVRVQAPTCDEESTGYTIYSCNLCGELFAADFVDGDGKGEHTFETVLDKDGHCAMNTCTTCGTVVAGCPEDILSEPTCTEPATCPLCGKEHGEVQHTWPAEPTKILSEPNEKTFESGWALYTCEECGATEKFEILAHDCAGMNYWSYVEYVPATAGSCTEAGVDQHYECELCDRLYWYDKDGNYVEVTLEDLTIKAAGHTAPAGTMPEKAPTCTTTGLVKYTCTACDKPVEEVLPVQHTWNEKDKVEIPATCTTYGYVIKACLLCTEGREFKVTEPSGHSDRPENATLVPATCTSNAYYTWTCTNKNCSNVNNVATLEVAGTILGHEVKIGTIKADCQNYGLVYTYCARVDKDGKPCCTGTAVSVVTTTVDVLNKEGKKETLELTFNLPAPAVVLTKTTTAKDSTNHPIPVVNGQEVVTRVPATCTTDGVEIYYCTACSKTPIKVSNILPKTGHTKGVEDNKAASCTGKGWKGYKCSTCNETVVTEWLNYAPLGIYESLEAALDAHPGLTNLRTYIQGDCDTVGYYTAECHAVVDTKTGKLCGHTFYIKDATSGNHVMPEKLPAKPQDMTLVFTEKGPHPVPAYDEAIYTWYSYDKSRSSYGEFVQDDEGNWFFNVDSFKEDGEFALNLVMEVNPDYLLTASFAAAEPTCTTNGWTAQFECSKCKKWIASETYIPAEETADNKAVHPELAALGHPTKVVLVEKIDATCTTGGRTEGWYCSTCEQGEESVPTAALGHEWEFVDDFEISKKYKGEQYCCATCGVYTVQDYVAVCEHNWVLNREKCVANTCYKNEKYNDYGRDVYTCTICNNDSIVFLEQADHVNKDGVVINACSHAANSKVDNVCVNCPKESNKITFTGAHAWTLSGTYAADCTTRGYKVYDCATCSLKKVEYITDKPAGHVWGEPTYVYADKNNTDIVAAIYTCACGETKKVNVESLLFTYEIVNDAKKPEEDEVIDITDGSLVKVIVNVTGNGDAFWGFKLNLPYSENLTFVDFASLNENFLVYANANTDKDLKTQWISIAGNASSDVVVSEKTALVALYFRVEKADRLNNMVPVVDKNGKVVEGKFVPEAITVGVPVVDAKGKVINEVTAEVYNKAGTALPYVSVSASANTVVLMELDGVEKISVSDILVAYNAMMEGKYLAAADVNKNGSIDAEDILVMYNYLVGSYGYDDVVKFNV